ncbi:MAG: sulfite exporter TauE/SafE family protein [Candidatus Aenigmarchaeota archaeon]|nr:sulfite exporter TauE/SafE family protein [Candidatus Aenigmarchaeota archaeon]
MDIISLTIIVALGFICGMYASLVGGYAILTIPALIFFGMPPHEAITTIKFASLALAIVGLAEFSRKKLVDYKTGFLLGIPAAIGSIIGAYVLIGTSALIVNKIIAFATIAILLVIMVKKDIGLVKNNIKPTTFTWIAGAILMFATGLYGGFYGAGFAIPISYLLILFFGQTFIECAGTRKIVSIMIILPALIVLGLEGMIVYSVGIPLLISSSVGGYIGAHYSTRIGNLWVKRMFFVVVLVMSLKLLF